MFEGKQRPTSEEYAEMNRKAMSTDHSAEARLRDAIAETLEWLERYLGNAPEMFGGEWAIYEKLRLALGATPDTLSASEWTWLDVGHSVNVSEVGTNRFIASCDNREDAELFCKAHNAAIQAARTADSAMNAAND